MLIIWKWGKVMEVFLISFFSAAIIFITVFYIIKALVVAFKSDEISLRKFVIFSSFSIGISVIIVSILPFGYQKIFDYI